MKNRTSTKIKVFLILFFFSSILLPTLIAPTNNAYSALDVYNVEKLDLDYLDNMYNILYNAEKTAKAKVSYRSLVHCAKNLDTDPDQLIVYWGMNGKWGGDASDGETDSGYNLDDDFLYSIRQLKTRDPDCSEGNLMASAFNNFASASLDESHKWNKMTYEKKNDFFCKVFALELDNDGENAFYNEKCREVTDTLHEVTNNFTKWVDDIGGNDLGDYAYIRKSENGENVTIEKLQNYINNLFSNKGVGSFQIQKEYTDAENYYAQKNAFLKVCVEGSFLENKPSTGHYRELYTFSINEAGDAINDKVQYVYVNDETLHFYSADPDADQHANYTVECRRTTNNYNANYTKSDKLNIYKNSVYANAALKSLANLLKFRCELHYLKYYKNLLLYYQSLSAEQKAGDKAEFVTWFNTNLVDPSKAHPHWRDSLAKKAEKMIGKGCFVESDKNPIYKCNMEEYVNALAATNPDPDAPKPDNFKGVESSDNDIETDSAKTCYDAGIEGMSWILCPATSNTSSAADGLERILRNWLGVKPDTVFSDGVKTAWEVFRNIANAVLIIIFLVIIFSQLTGYGIDNYGIKKMLPKLIIMAVFINLSYLICELAVDLSNILGVGLDNIFKNIGLGINPSADDFTISHFYSILIGLLGASGAVTGAVVASGGFGTMLIVTLLLALVTALISLFIFFVTLSARTIIIIVFTIIAPVAFALYILPNTQSLFKKWWKVFQAALIVFPICGALYGASYIIKAVVIGQDETGFVMGIIAVIAPFLPFLALPSLLKGAISGLGVLGGAITTLGGSLKSGVKGAAKDIKNSDSTREWATRRDAGYRRDGSKIENMKWWQKATRGTNKHRQNAALTYQKNRAEKGAREATEGRDFMLETETANQAKAIASSGEINSIGVLKEKLGEALTSKDSSSIQGRAKIRAYTDALAAKGDSGRGAIREAYDGSVGSMSNSAAKTFADNIMAKHSSDFKANDRAMFNIAQGINGATSDDATTKAKVSTENYLNEHKDELISKASVAALGNMDDVAFNELYGQHGEKISGDATIGKMAYEALSGPNAANIKKDRMEALQNIYERSGYSPRQTGAAQEGESFNVPKNKGETFEGGAGI